MSGTGVTDGILLRNSGSSLETPIIEVRGQRSDTNTSAACGGGIGLTRWAPNNQITDGQTVGSVYFGGAHGATTALEANILYTASIKAEADQTWSASGSMATDLVFRTGSTGRAYDYNQNYGDVEVMRLTHEGNVGIGVTNTTEKLKVGGNVILDATDANLKLKAGITGTTGSVLWTFNTDSTVFGQLDLDYDTRASVGLRMKSANGYPITIDGGSGIVFQEDAATIGAFTASGDFYVDTDTLYVDNSTNSVGIGTSAPGELLEVNGGQIEINSTGGVDSRLIFSRTNVNLAWIGIPNWDPDSLYLYGPNILGTASEAVMSYTQDILKLRTGDADRFVIDASGNTEFTGGRVLIDDAASNPGLHVTGGSGGKPLARFERDVGSTNRLVEISASGGNPQIRFREDANDWSIGVESNVFEIVDGSLLTGTSILELSTTTATFSTAITATGDITAFFSDERLKDIQGKILSPIEKIKTLDGFYYEPNQIAQDLGYEKKRHVGLSAQQVKAVLPEIIRDAPIDSKYMTLDYAKLVPLLVEAIKDQQEQIEDLKSLINN